MCNYWSNFVKTGDPNGNDADGTPMPVWKPYAKGCASDMVFGKNGAESVVRERDTDEIENLLNA